MSAGHRGKPLSQIFACVAEYLGSTQQPSNPYLPHTKKLLYLSKKVRNLGGQGSFFAASSGAS